MNERGLDSRAGVQLIRIVQEGLANVRKHAHAGAAQVVFAFDAGRIQVQIEDNGIGFDVAQAFKAEGQSFGLRSMRERAEAIGGTFQVLSVPGHGTRVIVEVPCESTRTGLRWTDRADPERYATTEHRVPDYDRPVASD
jgi:signal transduction histidine kinase